MMISYRIATRRICYRNSREGKPRERMHLVFYFIIPRSFDLLDHSSNVLASFNKRSVAHVSRCTKESLQRKEGKKKRPEQVRMSDKSAWNRKYFMCSLERALAGVGRLKSRTSFDGCVTDGWRSSDDDKPSACISEIEMTRNRRILRRIT